MKGDGTYMEYPLRLIQSQGVLNRPIACNVYHETSPCYDYKVVRGDNETIDILRFQRGKPGDENSVEGLLDVDLLEIVRDRLTRFQSNELQSKEGSMALQHIEEALMWLNKRVTDRIQRGVFQTDNK